MSGKMLRLIGGILVVLAALVPAVALADSVATTGNATSITDRSAMLNGVTNPSYPDSAWVFEYSTAQDYSVSPQYTKPQAAGNGAQAVSATVQGLEASTTYYYRLIVYWQSSTGAPDHRDGNTVPFTTTAKPTPGKKPPTGKKTTAGQVVLTSGTAAVRKGAAILRLGCRRTGGAARSFCLAKVSLSLPGTHGHRAVACGSGTYGGYTPTPPTLRVPLSAACRKAVAKAKHHRLRVRLHAVFLGSQPALSRSITLVG